MKFCEAFYNEKKNYANSTVTKTIRNFYKALKGPSKAAINVYATKEYLLVCFSLDNFERIVLPAMENIQSSFKSISWFQWIKNEHNIVCKKECGEDSASDEETVEKLLQTLQSYPRSGIFNADQIDLFRKVILMLNRTSSFKEKNVAKEVYVFLDSSVDDSET